MSVPRTWSSPSWIAALLAVAALALLALYPKHPLLLALRPFETLLALALGAGAMLLAWRRRARVGAGRTMLAMGVCAGLLAVVLGNEYQFRRQRAEVLAAPQAARTLGARFIVGYTDAGELAALAERGLIAGVYLTRRNIAGRPLEALRAEIAHWQSLRRVAGLPPLIVAADQEGGSVAHLSPPLPSLPPLSALIAGGSDGSLEERAAAYGETQGRALAELGVTMNFAPVVDLRPPRAPAFDLHTRTGERAIAADPALVLRVAGAYAEGLMRAGVTPTFKHFPGLGSVAADTHHFPARLDVPPARLAAADWQPFRQLGKPTAAIMLGHVVLPALDRERPASLSAAVVDGLLRRQWGYRGLLVTDDLNMGAVYRRGICRATLEALEAGVDLLLISYDPDQYFRAMHCALSRSRAA